MTFHISINSRTSDISREYGEGLKLDKPYEVGLKSFVTYNNIYNITENNNTLRVIYRAKANDKTIPKNNDNYEEGDEEEEE